MNDGLNEIFNIQNGGNYVKCISYIFLKNYTESNKKLNSKQIQEICKNLHNSKSKLLNQVKEKDNSLNEIFGGYHGLFSPYTNNIKYFLYNHFKEVFIKDGHNESDYISRNEIYKNCGELNSPKFCSMLTYYEKKGYFKDEKLKSGIINVIKRNSKIGKIAEKLVMNNHKQYSKVGASDDKTGIDLIDYNTGQKVQVKSCRDIIYSYDYDNHYLKIDGNCDFNKLTSNKLNVDVLALVQTDLSQYYMIDCRDSNFSVEKISETIDSNKYQHIVKLPKNNVKIYEKSYTGSYIESELVLS